jgi:hypothetical protein
MRQTGSPTYAPTPTRPASRAPRRSPGARSEAALQLKLDELIRTTEAARNNLMRAEDMPTDEIRDEAERLKSGVN